LFLFVLRRNHRLASDAVQSIGEEEMNTEFDFEFSEEIVFKISPLLKFQAAGVDIDELWKENENNEEINKVQ
jgi:hypothetical protein